MAQDGRGEAPQEIKAETVGWEAPGMERSRPQAGDVRRGPKGHGEGRQS